MKEGTVVLYPVISLAERQMSWASSTKKEIGIIIKRMPSTGGEVIYQVLCRDTTLKEYFDFELTEIP